MTDEAPRRTAEHNALWCDSARSTDRGVDVSHRSATLTDADRLLELRRDAILALAPRAIPHAEAETWAENLTVTGMLHKLREMEIWVAELNGAVVGWGAIRGASLEGLYTSPEFAGRGIGTGMLDLLEGLMRNRGIRVVCAEASSNAEEFYLRRGYQMIGARSPNGARPIGKRLCLTEGNRGTQGHDR